MRGSKDRKSKKGLVRPFFDSRFFATFPRMKYVVLLLVLGSLLACEQKPKTLFTTLSATESGVHFRNTVTENDTFNLVDYYYVYNGGGVAFGDLNNDNLPDLYFAGN